jgi:hypothetical protein
MDRSTSNSQPAKGSDSTNRPYRILQRRSLQKGKLVFQLAGSCYVNKGKLEQISTGSGYPDEPYVGESNDMSDVEVPEHFAQMDDLELGKVVNRIVGVDNAGGERISRQYWMMCLRRGYVTSGLTAISNTSDLDVECGNRGPEISPVQQVFTEPYLATFNGAEIHADRKQERLRVLAHFPYEILGENLRDEYDALEDDDDLHSVSAISSPHDTDRAHHKHCSFDCWLKTKEITPLEPLPHLRVPTSGVLEAARRRAAKVYEPLEPAQCRILLLEPGLFG